MRVLPYFNHLQQVTGPGRAADKPPAAQQNTDGRQDGSHRTPDAGRAIAPGRDEFIPSSPVSGVVYSYKAAPRRAGGEAEPVIKSGSYSFYQLNGSVQRHEPGSVGDKLDLKG